MEGVVLLELQLDFLQRFLPAKKLVPHHLLSSDGIPLVKEGGIQLQLLNDLLQHVT